MWMYKVSKLVTQIYRYCTKNKIQNIVIIWMTEHMGGVDGCLLVELPALALEFTYWGKTEGHQNNLFSTDVSFSISVKN